MFKRKVKKYGGIFDFDGWLKELEKLKQKSADPKIWNDNQNASKILKKISRIEKKIALWEDLDRRYNDMKVLFEFAEIGEVEIDEISI